MQRADDQSIGVYVHVPFCERVCPYCDFPVVATRGLTAQREDEYVGALLRELSLRREGYADRRLATVYLGGGTPSLLKPDSVARLLRAVADAFPGAPSEVTLEANPGGLSASRLAAFRDTGVTRLSLGVQSFQDALLRRLGRNHRGCDARSALEAAHWVGFERISADLMFAVPGQSPEQLERDLAELANAAPDHASAYELTVEPGTPFALAEWRGRLARPNEDQAIRMYGRVAAGLARAGLRRYEISSYAKPHAEAQHNQRYWRRQAVLGLGLGAHSLQYPRRGAPFGRRHSNLRDLPAYLARLHRGELPDAAAPAALRPATARGEAMFLALRTQEGLCAARFAAEFGSPPRTFFAAEIEELAAVGLLVESEAGDLRLNDRGVMVSDSVFERFAAAPSPPSPWAADKG